MAPNIILNVSFQFVCQVAPVLRDAVLVVRLEQATDNVRIVSVRPYMRVRQVFGKKLTWPVDRLLVFTTRTWWLGYASLW